MATKGSSVKKSAQKILLDMQIKLEELDSLRKELQKEKGNSITTKESRAMLEEIKVPSIEMIREDRKKQ
ncbi:MAG: hypothetical protein NUV67_00590 [archaeon]|nr:hypothetical protein [archaeon]